MTEGIFPEFSPEVAAIVNDSSLAAEVYLTPEPIPCAHKGCASTTKVYLSMYAVELETDSSEPQEIASPLCQDHLAEFLFDWIGNVSYKIVRDGYIQL